MAFLFLRQELQATLFQFMILPAPPLRTFMCHQNCGIHCDLGSENMKFTFYFRFYYLPIKTLAFVVKTCQDGKVNNILSTYHGVFSLGSRHEYCDYSRRLSIKCYPSKHYNPRKMYKNHCLSLFLGACIEGRVGALVVNT